MKGEKAPAAPCGTGLEAWRGSSMAMPGGMSVNRPSWRDGQEPQALRSTRIRATCRSERQRVRQRSIHCDGALAGPIRRSRFGCIEGRQAARGGDSPQGFPLEASDARSAAGAKAW